MCILEWSHELLEFSLSELCLALVPRRDLEHLWGTLWSCPIDSLIDCLECPKPTCRYQLLPCVYHPIKKRIYVIVLNVRNQEKKYTFENIYSIKNLSYSYVFRSYLYLPLLNLLSIIFELCYYISLRQMSKKKKCLVKNHFFLPRWVCWQVGNRRWGICTCPRIRRKCVLLGIRLFEFESSPSFLSTSIDDTITLGQTSVKDNALR